MMRRNGNEILPRGKCLNVRKAFHAGLNRWELKQRLEQFERELLVYWARRKDRDDRRAIRLEGSAPARKRIRRETANEWLLRKIYTLVRQLEAAGKISALDRHINDLPFSYRGSRSIDDKPFKRALSAFAGQRKPTETKRPKAAPFKREWRSIWGYALEYANRHDIEPKDLRKFIKAVGLKSCRDKVKSDAREPRAASGLRGI